MARVLFGDGEVVWEGEQVGDSFHVTDIWDGGVSEREITGRAPQLSPVPLADIHARGGKVLPDGSPD